jgi:DNA-binding HxlR family transcriptional regulator
MSDTNMGVPWPTATLVAPVSTASYEGCPVTGLVRRIGDRWTLVVLALLGQRSHRFNELHRAIDGISQRMLTRTLRTLEADGLVRREVFPTVPPAVEYSLTPSVRRLLEPLAAWALEHHRGSTDE